MHTQTALTDEQIRRFDEDGFLAIPRLVNDEVVEQLRDLYDRFLRREIDGGENDRMLGGLARQIMYPSQHHPYFRDNPALDAAREIAQSLLRTESEFLFDMFISKEPGNVNPTAWHQDWAYTEQPFAPADSTPRNQMMQFWLALDDVDQETGCMNFIPGAHNQGLREHYVFSGDPTDLGRMLGTADVDESQAVICPLPAGGCTVHVDGTLHYTPGNRSKDRQRRAYIFNFRPKGATW